ncbi:PAS domain S-box protein [Oceanirhabdus seepicola]|uniref:histidine kinase n=2 Tax=Oceanirhabdus seepicola TaxID=2828781 RepID=A0A9J6P4D2_9CLOT|nr:PAS domain-containing sensor histidine kinase [Oceanirhabdus seepicola]MCM1991642.1 PAS domain S-box protein [Oceanirhabdus seepicola]
MNYILTLFAIILLFTGAYNFIKNKITKSQKYISGILISIILIIGYMISCLNLYDRFLYLVFGFLMVIISCGVFCYFKNCIIGKYITGLSGFFLGGIYIIDFFADLFWCDNLIWYLIHSIVFLLIGIGMVICYYEISQIRLAKVEERNRQLVEALPDGICIHVNGEILYMNSALGELIGIDNPEEFIGEKVLDIIHEEYNKRIKKHLVSMKKGQQPRIIEEKIIRNDGQVINIEVCDTFYEYDGKLGILSIIRDISERKRAEELQRRVEEEERNLKEAKEYERLRNEFFANLSHEFKTPLNLIFCTVQLLKVKLANDEEKINQYIKILNQNGYRLLRLINNLIDITKIDANYFDIDLQNCNIVSIVEEITLSVAQYIENKNIEIIFDTDIEEKVMACDPDKIERIILNLLSNSIKFTKSGGSITVNTYDKGESIIISMKDTGIGIPKEKLNVIFNRFAQVDKSTTRNHEGSGIGLSLVKSLVEMHEGTIEVKSEYGKGTEFIIELPVKLLNEETKVEKNNNINQDKVERINIEFSDIYE